MSVQTEYKTVPGVTGARRGDGGFSLVELMVAMALGLLLIGAVVQSYMGSKQVYNMTEGMSRMQENYRYAMLHFAKSLDSGGYAGCLENLADNHTNTLSETSGVYDYAAPVSGTDGGTDPDTITITRSKGVISVPIVGVLDKSDALQDLTVEATAPGYSELQQFTVVTVSNCTSAATFMITNEPDATGVIQHRLSPSAPGPLALHNTQTDLAIAGTLGDGGVSEGGGGDTTAMLYANIGVEYKIDTGANAADACDLADSTKHRFCSLFANDDELVEGVHDLQVTYGIPGGTGLQYVGAGTLTTATAQTVETVRLVLSMNSVQPVDGKDVVRKDFTRVFRVRNRAPE
jgi:type IV pilus assembly protein PilW